MRGKEEEREHREESNSMRDWEGMCILTVRREIIFEIVGRSTVEVRGEHLDKTLHFMILGRELGKSQTER